MQTVGALFSGFGGGATSGLTPAQNGGMVGGASGGMPSGYGASGGFSASGALGALRLGTSAVSALSGFAMSQYQANALDDEAANERLAARGDYVQAQEKSNQINLAYNRVIGAQLADASAGNIDVGSGSVQEAGRQAEQQRDRVNTAALTTAQIDANIRSARAQMLSQSASITRTTGIISGLADVAKAGLQYAELGG